MKINFTCYFFALLFFFSCGEKEQPVEQFNLENGLLILNEGTFNFNNATLSFIDSDGKIENNVFERANNQRLGDIAQSISFKGDKSYIVVNNSGKIEVCNTKNMLLSNTITGLNAPRQISFKNDEIAYVSNIFDNKIDEINLSNFEISNSFESECPLDFYDCGFDKMIKVGQDLAIFNLGTKSLDIFNFEEGLSDPIQSIDLEFLPADMVFKDGYLYVISSELDEANLNLFKIKTEDWTIEEYYNVPDAGIFRNIVFFIGDDLHISSSVIQKVIFNGETVELETVMEPNLQSLYGIAYSPTDPDYLYLSEALDFVQNGYVFQVKIPEFSFVDTFQVGINPSKIYFLD